MYAASNVLRKANIICGDYLSVLKEYARPGDFIFLDPPYLPVSEYSDFKRYTKEQFYEEDHVELAKEVLRLHEMGCYVILTNSNHPLVHELYKPFSIEVIQTKRYISCSGSNRKGEDVIVTALPKGKAMFKFVPEILPEQVYKYPSTRFMGSKSKLLSEIWAVASQFQFDTVVDLFAGSGIVGYMFKAQGKTVVSNDYMAMSATFAKAMIENNGITLKTIIVSNTKKKMESDIISEGQYMRINKTLKQIPEELLNNNIEEITEEDIQKYLNTLKNYSNSSIKKFYELLSQAFRSAYERDYIKC